MTAHQLGDGGRCVLCGCSPLVGDGGYCAVTVTWTPTGLCHLAEHLYARLGTGLWCEGMALLDEHARSYRILSVWLTDLTLAADEAVWTVNVANRDTWGWSWTDAAGTRRDCESRPLLLDLRDAGTGGVLLDRVGLCRADLWYASGWHLYFAGGRTYKGATLGEVAAKWLLDNRAAVGE